jgi:MerR family transcriptional regulator, light-induced transcriptional regulator
MASASSGLLSIGDICSETGLSSDVIRVWERRYGFPVPVRLPSGHRRYRQEDLNRLRLIAEAVAEGHRPSKVVNAEETDLKRLLTREGSDVFLGTLDPVFDAVKAMDSAAIRNALMESMRDHGLRTFLQHIVSPLLDRVGMAWADGSLGIHHEHLLSEVLEDVLRQLRLEQSPRTGQENILLATLPGERHRLGLLMAALCYAARGYRTELLGVDLPVASIAQAARTLKAHRVAVSLSIQSAGESTRRLLMDLQERLPNGCRLVIGGHGAARTRRIEGVERMIGLEGI